jgi:DHA1 family tetracycline resistance protein-like MFS transporter
MKDGGMDASSPRKPALGFIFITLILMVLGFSIIIPVLPALVTQFQGGNVAEGSEYYGTLMGVFAVMQFIASPILGSLSDRFGRRRVILIALAGSAIDYVIMGFAPNMTWMFIARMVSGATAGTLATCNAYIADVTPPEKRAQGFGLVGAAFGVGFVLGPLIGGFFGRHNIRLPFFVAAGFVATNWLYGAFVLPESLRAENRRPFSWMRANPVGSLLALRRFRGVFDLACMHFIFMFANSMLQSIWVLYTSYRYGWTPLEVGLSLTFIGVMAIVVQGAMVRRIIARTGERRGLVLGLSISCCVMAAYGLATQGWMIYALVLLGAWGGIAGPAAQALITRHVPPNEQGAVQGSLIGLQSLAGIFAPLFSAWSFGKCIAPDARWHLPGIAFFESSALIIGALGLAFRSFHLDDRAAAKSALAGQAGAAQPGA